MTELDTIDEVLAHCEDILHGKDCEDVTNARKLLIKAKRQILIDYEITVGCIDKPEAEKFVDAYLERLKVTK